MFGKPTSGRSAIAAGELDWQSAADALVYPALAIVACVVAQMIVTIGSRILIRRVGMAAAFDLRNRMYAHLQLQGPGFFGRYSIGDLMARATIEAMDSGIEYITDDLHVDK